MSLSSLPPALRVAIWMSLSATAFAFVVAITRHIGDDLHVFVISFWRYVFSVLMFVPWIMRVGLDGLRTGRLGIHVLRSACLVISGVAMLTSVTLMPLDEMTAISFTTPLFAMIGAIVFLKERAGPRRWAALIIGFLGVLIILRPGAGIFNWAAFLVILSSITFAGAILYGKILTRTESPELMVLLLAIIAVPLSFPLAAYQWQWPTLTETAWLVLLALCSNANMFGIAKALQAGDASATQPFDFLRLPTTAAVGWIAFSEPSDIFTWLGAAVIFSSTIYITRREAAEQRRAAQGFDE